ncbi:MAG: hypothetical protein AAF495_27800 [Pseudomonadota bacterium]
MADQAIQDAFDNPFDTPDLPPWSIVAKYNENTTQDPEMPLETWETHMYKIPGYCPQRAVAAVDGACVGGEWFYLLYRDGLPSFQFNPTYGSVPAYGKAPGFCIECHSPVENTDWLWVTHDILSRERQLGDPFRFDGEAPGQAGSGQCYDVTELSPVLPPDVAVDPNKVPAPGSPQRMFDCFAWESFIALNWPESETQRGQADLSAPFGRAEGNRVWETWPQVYETFQANDPQWTLDGRSFNDPQPLPDVCQAALDAHPLADGPMPIAHRVLNERHQAYGNQFNTIVDQNGNRLRFNIRFNEPEWNFIKENGYADTGSYDYNGPANSDTLVFPDNQTPGFDIGAIEIKAAWKELCTDPITCNPIDDPARYCSRDIFIYEAAVEKTLGTQPATCPIVQAGLVGFHLVSKTFWAPQWTWTTFEHVDNVPDVGEEVDPTIFPNPYTLFTPQCLLPENQPSPEFCLSQRPGLFGIDQRTLCCENLQVIHNSAPDPLNGAPFLSLQPPNEFKVFPAQITRLDPIEQHAAELNPVFQHLLQDAGSPFQYYQLITSQWARNGRLSGDSFEPFAVSNQLCREGDAEPCFTLEPTDVQGPAGRRLRNTTMETFQVSYCAPDDQDISNDPANCTPEDVVHDPMQSSSAGCINCHFSAGTDSSFVWLDAVLAQVPLTSGAEPGSGLVFRFLNVPMGTHFYTASAEERDVILETWPDMVLEGVAYFVNDESS